MMKDSISVSEKISGLTNFQFDLLKRLHTAADGNGRCDACPETIRDKYFCLEDSVTAQTIEDGIQALAEAECISLCSMDGRRCLCFQDWKDPQLIREIERSDAHRMLLFWKNILTELENDMIVVKMRIQETPESEKCAGRSLKLESTRTDIEDSIKLVKTRIQDIRESEKCSGR